MIIPAVALQELGYLPMAGQHRPPALIRAMREDPAAFIRGAAVQLKVAQKLDCFEGPKRSECLPTDPWPFTWVEVDKHAGTPAPETVTVWRVESGQFHAVYRTRANTGILHSTPDGSWPIVRRYRVTTMQGFFPVPIPRPVALLSASTEPVLSAGLSPIRSSATLAPKALSSASAKDALSVGLVPSAGPVPSAGLWHGAWVRWQPYDDTGIKWVSYFDGGRALHYFPRARYGFPQSAGCVEMPLNAAHVVYRLTRMGTVVTVTAGSATSGQENAHA
uniref:L,D-TPase catalytic domain-containing protein n=1 Tax=mine drainage metagenome TaxID=410659 RepID=E6QM09_9ZZZZ